MFYGKKKLATANNIKHKGNTLWYKSTVAFDMILLYLQQHEDKNTKNTSLMEFQGRLSQYIYEFNPQDYDWNN